MTKNKPFGYVLKSQVQTNYPWCQPHRWSDAADCLGNFRKHIGQAQVFKRLPKGYTALEIVPVYADPRAVGEAALLA